MRRFVCSILALTLVAALAAIGARSRESGSQTARGVVFHDANGNRVLDAGEQRLGGIRVSNGREIVQTDDEGRYELPVGDDTILFIVKPRGWRTPLSETNLPQFYYVHKPHGSPSLKYAGVAPTGPLPESVDFPLYPQDEPESFKALLFGDPQPRDIKEVEYIAHDVVEELIGTDASFGVTLGDIVFDDLSVFEPLTQTIAVLGIPWYNVIGNHDINSDASDDRHSDETFERVFGPAYYSFDYGPVHFLVLDDIEWIVEDPNRRGRYRGGLGEVQMEFIKNDLARIPGDQLVVLMMHIPLVDVEDRHDLYRLIEQRPFCLSISGHTHWHAHRFITREDGWQGPAPHHHIINVTVCGSWWRGAPDERSIPHALMADGGPNGYSTITFDGHEYTLDYKAAGRPADYQMAIHAPESVPAGDAARTWVYANVFNGSERSTVEMRLGDGPWVAMQHTVEVDPQYQRVYDLEKSLEKSLGKAPWQTPPAPKESQHLWKACLPVDPPPGIHVLTVRTADMHGRTHEGRRVIRVEAAR